MSRRCPVCAARGRDGRMRDGRRHVHELEPGTAFLLPVTGEVRVLERLKPGRALLRDPSPGEEVSFETHGGREVSFRRSGSDTVPCSPTAQVEPLRRSRT